MDDVYIVKDVHLFNNMMIQFLQDHSEFLTNNIFFK